MDIFSLILGARHAALSNTAGVVEPTGDSFTLDALLPLGAAFLYALSGVMTRILDGDVPSPLINLYSTVVSLVAVVLLTSLFGGFSVLGGSGDLAWIIAMGCVGGAAVLALVVSFRMTEQSNLAPFSRFGILIAFVLGWLFFKEAPVDDLFPGALLIVAVSLVILWRERQLKLAKPLFTVR